MRVAKTPFVSESIFIQPNVESLAIHRPGSFLIANHWKIAFGLQIDPLNIGRKIFWNKRPLDFRPELFHLPAQLSDVT